VTRSVGSPLPIQVQHSLNDIKCLLFLSKSLRQRWKESVSMLRKLTDDGTLWPLSLWWFCWLCSNDDCDDARSVGGEGEVSNNGGCGGGGNFRLHL